jgi:hypothetical protein
MTPRRTLVLLAVSAGALGAPATPAFAQSGVIIDDDSPTGKEYAIPLESARRDAAGQSGSSSGSGSSAPLFGAGVGDSETDSTKARSRPKSSGKNAQKTTRQGDTTASVQTGRTAAATVPEGGLGSLVTIIAVAASVLLLGAVIGSIARRRSA